MKRTRAKDTDDESGGTAPGGIQALDAALAVLRVLRSFDGPATLSDIAREAGMPPSKAHRYLASFIHAGLAVQKERSGRYDLGREASEMGVAAISRNNFVVQASDELEELATMTGQAALLAVWSHNGPTVVRLERGPSLTTTSIGLGSTFPLLDSATGRIFLSYLPHQQLRARLEQELDRATATGVSWPDLNPDAGSLEALATKIRRERVAFVDGRYIPGLIAISTAITNWQREIEVAVTLFGTHKGLLQPDSPARNALIDFASRHSIVSPDYLGKKTLRKKGVTDVPD
ncbi:IclR family transcriptional regulator [Bradyrhizobium sp. CCGUVB14]|uniref:IclR family transcriptional regulator n=1 Tax=Bradyrhizobium sp. CCGUVB14 TaxID=2949628 RepID=UPI0020B21E34|nr:IclR family transcriptional regulator [Bradyrhizobium sp. CCGUVB14]MCP3446115.1 IclR family transcriptional regulator [Bradyrhizobium sp. CCGUVB14]